MSILALASPVSLGGQLLIALVILLLVGLLIRAIRGVSFTGRSMGRAVVAAVTGVVAFVALSSLLNDHSHARGMLAAFVGALSGAFVLQPVRRESTSRLPSDPKGLTSLAFISGPVLGLLLASLVMLLSDVSPLDRGHLFASYTVIGTMAGFLGAIIVAIASASASRRSSESGEQD